MRTATLGGLAALLIVAVWGCGSSSPDTPDGGQTDTAVADDALEAGEPEAGPTDSGATDGPSDAAVTVPLGGFGAISGACGVIAAADLTATTPRLVQDVLDFGATAYSSAHLTELSAGGQHMIADDNLGGSSLLSEVFAYEVLYRCELATLLKTEKEIGYLDGGTKKTDFLVEIEGLKIGVSVVRAYVYPGTTPMDVSQATTLLTGKLSDIKTSTGFVSPADAWEKQILAVIAFGSGDVDSVATAWAGLDPSVRGDTVVVVTQTNGDDAPLYN